jgi:dTDP-4-amino-4,6-dideoxygalactose transaminase
LKLRTHGITKDVNDLEKSDGGWYYEMQDLGFNYRIPDILCALGLSQLKAAETRLLKRIEIAERYDAAFSGSPLVKPLCSNKNLRSQGIQHAYHLYIVTVKNRLALYKALREKNIFSQVHYIPVYTMPYYQKNGYKNVSCPKAEKYYSECLSLPMYPTLKAEEQEFVIKSILQLI